MPMTHIHTVLKLQAILAALATAIPLNSKAMDMIFLWKATEATKKYSTSDYWNSGYVTCINGVLLAMP